MGSPLDELIDMYEGRAKLARQVRDLIGDDLRFAAQLHAVLSELLRAHHVTSEGRPGPRRTARPGEGSTVFDRVVSFFVGTSNRWARLSEIAGGAGVKRGTLGHVLYRAHRDKFEDRRESCGGQKATLWRLRPEVYDEAKGGEP